MRKYIYIMISGILAVACQDYRYDEMVKDSFYFQASSLQQQTVFVMDDNDYTYPMWIHKSGLFQNEISGRVELDFNYLVQYNDGNDTDYKMLPEDYFDFERDFTIPEGCDELNVPLILKANKVVDELGYGTYYIPVTVKSRTPQIVGYEDKSHLLLEFNVTQAHLMLESENKGIKLVELKDEIANMDLDITTALNAEATVDVDVEYSVINDFEIPFDNKILPENCYTFLPSVKIPKGQKYAFNTLTLKVEEIPSGECFVLPLKFSVVGNEKINVNENDYLTLIVSK